MFINKDINTFSFINNWQLVAQAELVAANEERIQSSRSSSSSSGPSSGSAAAHQQITSSLLSSALASAGIPQASTSRSHSKPFILLYYLYVTLILKTRAKLRGDEPHTCTHTHKIIRQQSTFQTDVLVVIIVATLIKWPKGGHWRGFNRNN